VRIDYEKSYQAEGASRTHEQKDCESPFADFREVPARTEQLTASDVTYEIVQHDGGWAYKVNGVFSEPFPTHTEALASAQLAAAEQELPGDAETIEYEDEGGEWHSETVSGRDRPHAVVKDTNN
jgi:Uncharacterized protein conserved in bacteria (DUF2188)